jgi:predicted  nucleic acid-binding Zn ribbon protein
MYKQRISITINSDLDREKLSDDFIILLGSLSRTGQITGGVESPYLSGDEIICYQTTLEPNSFDSRHNDKWVNLKIKNLEEGCNSKLETKVMGQHIPSYKDICTCGNRDSYVLFTTYCNESSPIDCGNCGHPVPIYQLTGLTDEDRVNIEAWKANYVACDNLNMGCKIGEKWAIKQMSDPKSQLSRSGRDLCDSITKGTATPTYYYLFNYRAISASKDKLRRCPSCNGEWLMDKPWLDFYDFKCDACKLVSTLTGKS